MTPCDWYAVKQKQKTNLFGNFAIHMEILTLTISYKMHVDRNYLKKMFFERQSNNSKTNNYV